MDRLGYTIAAIAAEKGGIIKPGVPVVIGARDREARAGADLDRDSAPKPGFG